MEHGVTDQDTNETGARIGRWAAYGLLGAVGISAALIALGGIVWVARWVSGWAL
jgi:hypothetical protein